MGEETKSKINLHKSISIIGYISQKLQPYLKDGSKVMY